MTGPYESRVHWDAPSGVSHQIFEELGLDARGVLAGCVALQKPADTLRPEVRKNLGQTRPY